MRFEPIETLPSRCPNFIEDAYDALVNEIGVYAWHWHEPRTADELERFLMRGESRRRRSDSFEINATHGAYDKLALFDHAVCFKSTHAPFVLTMPYVHEDTDYYRNFDAFADAYYHRKPWVTDVTYPEQKMVTAIVPDRFKVRENGDFAAIVATDSAFTWLRDVFGITSDNGASNE